MGKVQSKLIDCLCYRDPYDPHSDTSTQDPIDDTFNLPRRMPAQTTPVARLANKNHQPRRHNGHKHRNLPGRHSLDQSTLIIDPGTMFPLATSTPQQDYRQTGFASPSCEPGNEQRIPDTPTPKSGTEEIPKPTKAHQSHHTADITTTTNTSTNKSHTPIRRPSRLFKDPSRALRRCSRLTVGPYIHGGIYSGSELGLPEGEYMYGTEMFQVGPSHSAVGVAGERRQGFWETGEDDNVTGSSSAAAEFEAELKQREVERQRAVARALGGSKISLVDIRKGF
ncbi:hypothetical protein ABW20_dc0106348 [Dactylellina cionopaga]|nr:hypothetical protein ABW20_dc0106348 [Dactylellina cionopaga]